MLMVCLFFADPVTWESRHVSEWLSWASREFDLTPAPDPSRFPRDGRGLLALSLPELEDCAGSPRAARLLQVHLAHLRHALTGRAASPLADHDQLQGTQGKHFALLHG